MDYIAAGTECRTKGEFAEVLRSWLRSDHEAVVGEPSSYGGKALVWVDLDGQRFHLNGDSRDEGVEDYLRLVDRHGADLPWHVVANTHGKVNAVAFGDPPQKIRYFYLYAKDEAAAPYVL